MSRREREHTTLYCSGRTGGQREPAIAWPRAAPTKSRSGRRMSVSASGPPPHRAAGRLARTRAGEESSHIGKDQIGVVSDIPLLAGDVLGSCGAVGGQLHSRNEGAVAAALSLLRKS